MFEEIGVSEAISFRQATVDGLHPGRTAEILLDNEVIGFVGAIHPEAEKDIGSKRNVCVRTEGITCLPL